MGLAPISHWEIEGFRSVRERVALEFGPLNILVGANSAGKSTLVQSILLTAQTLGTPLTEKPLVLNGPLAQLGLPSDCVHEQAGKEFAIGFSFHPLAELEFARSYALSEDASISVEAEFAISGESFELANARLRAQVKSDPSQEQAISYVRKTKKATEQELRDLGLKGQRVNEAIGRYAVPVEVTSESLPGVVAARFRQFLPEALFQVEDLHERALAMTIRGITELLDMPRDSGRAAASRTAVRARVGRRSIGYWTPQRLAQYRIPDEVMRFLRAYLAHESIELADKEDPTYSLTELHDALSPDGRRLVADLFESDWYRGHVEDLAPDNALTSAVADEPVDSLVDAARYFFSGFVRHLGPLREEPKPIYGLSEAASGNSVGRSGEYTAAILDAFGSREVVCPRLEADPQQMSLDEAVNYWLEAMGLLSSLQVEERGKLGYEMKLHIHGVRKSLDLTAVGVGVSQVLPVIVQGLIAPPGSFLVYEQPELHLHPDVQAGIGDFCLALAHSGRQLLVETHSEYLVNRLRLRAASDESDQVHTLVRLFFVERPEGASTVRPVSVTEFGAIPDWPAGFLDQAAHEAEAIMRAVRQKGDSPAQGTD